MDCMRRFAQLELSYAIPDETTILNFKLLIEKHQLSATIFANINQYIVEKGIKVSQGSMVYATIIHAPALLKTKTKNATLICAPPVKTTNIILVLKYT